MAADGSELSSKRVSKLSRRYHLHKKQLRQSAMMAEGLSDVWLCPSCLYENQDYQRCMGPGCDVVRPGGLLDSALSTQPPPTSSNRRSTISVPKNHPAADARRSNPPPPSSTRVAGARREDKCFQKHCLPIWPQTKADGDSFNVSSSHSPASSSQSPASSSQLGIIIY